jgi:vancomycin resistance protein YoaR
MRRPDLSDENFRRSLMDFGLDEAYRSEPDPEPELSPGLFPDPGPGSAAYFAEPGAGPLTGSFPGAGPSSTGLDFEGYFRDPDPEPLGPPPQQVPQQVPQPGSGPGPNEGPLRVVPEGEATALLRIRLPDSPPVPATTLRSDSMAIERVQETASMLAPSNNPSRPTALPGDLVALTTATMVVPLSSSLAAQRSGLRSTLLTASVPPDFASRAEADLLSDTVEQFFGDFDAIGRDLAASRDDGLAVGAEGGVPSSTSATSRSLPSEEYSSGGRYGVPTRPPGYDAAFEAARRSPVGMRYLGGIFHDSSGESSFYDPETAALVPLSRSGVSEAPSEFRRDGRPPGTEPFPPLPPMPPQGRPQSASSQPRPPMPSQRHAASAERPREHWNDHRPDHHRTATLGRRRLRIVTVSALAGLLAFGGVYGAALALEGQVPKGTFVDGVAIGGMTRLAAEAKLADVLGPMLTAPIQLTADGTSFSLPTDQAGLKVDWADTVAAASVDRNDPLVAIPALVGFRRTAPLRTSIDRVALRAAIVKATAAFNRPMVDGGVVFPAGVPTPIAPKPGRTVDLDAAVKAVADAFGAGASGVEAAGHGGAIQLAAFATAVAIPPIALTVQDIPPTVTPAAVAAAMQDFARPAMSGPVTLVTGGVKTVLKPAVVGKYLAIVPDGHGGLVPKLDGAGLRTEVDQAALAKLETPAVNAAFTVTAGKPVLVPGKPGVGFAPDAVSASITAVLTKTATQRTATVATGPLPPAFSTEAAQALGIQDVTGTYTAPFTATTARSANVRRAADLLRGQILQPGQTLSLNQVLGARTTANGFTPVSESSPAADAGAGTSLVATALFNAEYLAGLHDVEHHPHSSLTDRFPAGMEAAVSFPDVDLKFQNDSGAPIYLWTSATDSSVTVAVLGQKAYDSIQTEVSPRYAIVQPKSQPQSGNNCTPQDPVPGFQIDVTRIMTKNGQPPIRQVFHTSYAPQGRLGCSSQSTTTNASTPTPGGGGSTQGPDTPTSSSPPSSSVGGGTGTTPPPPTSAQPSGWDGSLLGGLLGAPGPPKH